MKDIHAALSIAYGPGNQSCHKTSEAIYQWLLSRLDAHALDRGWLDASK